MEKIRWGGGFDAYNKGIKGYTFFEAWYDEIGVDKYGTLGKLCKAIKYKGKHISRTTLYRWFEGQRPSDRYKDILLKITDNMVSPIDWM